MQNISEAAIQQKTAAQTDELTQQGWTWWTEQVLQVQKHILIPNMGWISILLSNTRSQLYLL